eukprot:14301942-Alexandrium_andersonii.AAC.1
MAIVFERGELDGLTIAVGPSALLAIFGCPMLFRKAKAIAERDTDSDESLDSPREFGSSASDAGDASNEELLSTILKQQSAIAAELKELKAAKEREADSSSSGSASGALEPDPAQVDHLLSRLLTHEGTVKRDAATAGSSVAPTPPALANGSSLRTGAGLEMPGLLR